MALHPHASRLLALTLAAAVSALGRAGGTSAWAQESTDWAGPGFDCRELIKSSGLAQSGLLRDQGATSVELILPPQAAPPRAEDPIDVIETFEGVPRLARGIADLPEGTSGYGSVICTLILIGFETNPDPSAEAMFVRRTDLQTNAETLPVLLLLPVARDADESLYFALWSESDYQIPIYFPVFDHNSPIDIRNGQIKTIDYFDVVGTPISWSAETATIVRLDTPPPGVDRFLEEGGAAAAMMVLCGNASCRDLARLVLGGDPQQGDPQQGDQWRDDPPAHTTPDPVEDPTSITREVRLAYLGSNGVESTRSLDAVGPLECILGAIGPDMFEAIPQWCLEDDRTQRAHRALADRDVLIRVEADGRWLVVDGAARRPPQIVEVELPPGRSIANCGLHLIYQAPDGGEVSIPFNPRMGEQFFEVYLQNHPPLPLAGDKVLFRIEVTGEADCGGPSREVVAPSDMIVTVPLVEGRLAQHAVAHIVTLNAADLDRELGLDSLAREGFGRAVLGAVQAAHVRLAATNADRTWALVSGNVGALENDGSVRTLGSLGATTLRSGGLSAEAIPLHDATLATNQALSDRLPGSLRPLVDAANDGGIDRVTITLIGAVARRDGGGSLVDPCTDRNYVSLPRELTSPDGPTVELAVFPLVHRSESDAAPDLSALTPLSFAANAPGVLGGLYACRGTPPGLAVYPFFLEPWRAEADITPRYATALSDQLASLLETLLTQEEATR